MRDHAGFCDIADYGFLSDCRSAALVSSDGQVDWLCWPRFDSPSIFAAILDPDRGGSCRIAPAGLRFSSSRRYLPHTNVLETTFRCATGTVIVTDWLHTGARQALCRRVSCVEGHVRMISVCDPRPGYGRTVPSWGNRLGWLVCDAHDGQMLVLDGQSSASEQFELRAGEQRAFSLCLGRPGPSDITDSLHRAITYWSEWASGLRLPDYASELVERSALTLKGLQYKPTGAIVAAATTSLPEDVGGERNWDYRYSWLRDASWTLHALRQVHRHEEAGSYLDWLKAIVMRHGALHLQIMYGIGGEADLEELTLDHLRGWRDSRPVRIGNGAAGQRQLDVYGELADAIWLHRCASRRPLGPHRARLLAWCADQAAASWRLPDEGIWEVRGGARHFTYSKVMCWVALDRAIRAARKDRISWFDVGRYKRERDAIRAEVERRGWSEAKRAFVQAYGSDALDASALLLAQVGFLRPDDPRFASTVAAIERELTRGGLVDRYRIGDAADDGLSGEEGTFSICALWLCQALVSLGEIDRAREVFERVTSCASDLGLLSEELTPDGLQLGNFPQAFSHISLIVAAFALDQALKRRGALTEATSA